MNVFLRILIGLVLVAIGAFMTIRTRVLLDTFGTVAWAEAKLGGGGSNLFYKLFGIVFCLVGFIVATNMWDAFLQATLGSFIPSPTP